MAARAEPMAKVRAMVPLTLMPMSSAAPRSSETACMACPGFVRFTKSIRAIIITMLARMVTMVVAWMVQGAARQHQGRQLHYAAEGLSVRAESQQRHILQQIADADSGDQHSQIGAGVPQGLVGHPLNDDSQNRTHNHGDNNGNDGIYMKSRHSGKHYIGPDHNDIAVGKIQHLGDTVNHRISQGDNRVHTSETDSVNQIRQETTLR